MRPFRLALALAVTASACSGPGSPAPGSRPAPGEQLSHGRWRAQVSGGTLRVVEAADGAHVLTLPHEGKIDPALFSPGDDALVTVTAGCVRLHALPSGAPGPMLHQPLPAPAPPKSRWPSKAQVASYKSKREEHLKSMARLARFTPSGRVLVATSDHISLYDPVTGSPVGGGITTHRPRARFTEVFLDRDETRLLTVEEEDADRLMCLWSAPSFTRLARIKGAPSRAAFSPDGHWLVCYEACREPPVQVFDLGSLGEGDSGILRPVCLAPFTPAGCRLAVVDEQGIRFEERGWPQWPWRLTLLVGVGVGGWRWRKSRRVPAD
jgi:hypothetical protein